MQAVLGGLPIAAPSPNEMRREAGGAAGVSTGSCILIQVQQYYCIWYSSTTQAVLGWFGIWFSRSERRHVTGCGTGQLCHNRQQ